MTRKKGESEQNTKCQKAARKKEKGTRNKGESDQKAKSQKSCQESYRKKRVARKRKVGKR